MLLNEVISNAQEMANGRVMLDVSHELLLHVRAFLLSTKLQYPTEADVLPVSHPASRRQK